MIDPMRRSKQDQLWQVMTKVDNAKLTLSRDHYNWGAKNYHAEYACFTPFLRNRNDNRDGRMQAAEMKWYIPSVSESGYAYRGGTGVAVTFQAARARPLGQRHGILYIKGLYGKSLYLYPGVPQRVPPPKL